MNELIEEVIEETRRLADRELTFEYESYVELVDKRQQLVDLISKGMLSVNDKQRIQQLKIWDNAILSRMQLLKEEANAALTRIQKSKKQQATYNPQTSHEGFMFDKKN